MSDKTMYRKCYGCGCLHQVTVKDQSKVLFKGFCKDCFDKLDAKWKKQDDE